MKFAPRKFRDNDALRKTADGFAEQLSAAEKITDPAERLEALLMLNNDVQDHAGKMFRAIINRSVNFDMTAFLGTAGGSIAGGIALISLVNPAVGAIVLIGGILGSAGMMVKGGVGKWISKRAERELEDHCKSLNETLTTTGKDIETILTTQSNAVAASEKFGSLYDRFPEIRDSFIKTFNQAFARGQLPPAPQEPKPQAQQKFTL